MGAGPVMRWDPPHNPKARTNVLAFPTFFFFVILIFVCSLSLHNNDCYYMFIVLNVLSFIFNCRLHKHSPLLITNSDRVSTYIQRLIFFLLNTY